MKKLLFVTVLMFSLTYNNLGADGDPTAEEISTAKQILSSGINKNDPEKGTKIALILDYLIYASKIGDQKILKTGTKFLEEYKESMNYSQSLDFKRALASTVVSYISNKSVAYNEQAFKEKTTSLFKETDIYKRVLAQNTELSADQLAGICIKYIILDFNYLDFAYKYEPGIQRVIAEYMVAENGLFFYMLNKINNLPPEYKELKEAYYISLLTLNDIVLSDAKTQGAAKYKGFVVPELCRELRMLTEYEETKDIEIRYSLLKERAEKVIFKTIKGL